MLKQVSPTAAGTKFDKSLAPLPPLSTLPQWTRVNNLARTCPPKQIQKDRPRPQDPKSGSKKLDSSSMDALSESDDGLTRSSVSGGDTDRRVYHLEHNIIFLREQHDEILNALHEEVDRLKRENQGLQFRLSIADDRNLSDALSKKNFSDPQSQPTRVASGKDKGRSSKAEAGTLPSDSVPREELSQTESFTSERTRSGRRPGSRHKVDERRLHGLETEVLELRKALREEKHRNLLLEEQLDQARAASLTTDGAKPQVPLVRVPRPPMQPRPSGDRQRHPSNNVPVQLDSQVPGVTSVTVKQLDVDSPRSETSQPRTVPECEEIIRKLESDNSKQAQELNHLKSELHDALYSQKWTPDAFLLAKAYVAADSDQPGQRHLQRFQLKPPVKKLPDTSSLTLPPMRLALGNKAADRNKRSQQLLHRTRLERELVSTHGDVSDGH